MTEFLEQHQFLIGIALGIFIGLGIASVYIYIDMNKVLGRIHR